MQLNHWFSPNIQIKPTLINPIYVPLNHTAEKNLSGSDILDMQLN